MTLNFKLTKDLSGFSFGIGIDFETKSFMIAFLYWCFSITSIKLKKPINNIEVVEPQIIK
jgi:hypothetical protein